MYVRDLQGNEFPMMATYTIADEINGNITLSADLYPNKANIAFIQDIDALWNVVTDDGTTYKVKFAQERGEGFQMFKTIRAIPKVYDDLENKRVYERFDGSTSIENLLTIVFRDTGYSYRLIGSWNNIEIEGFGDGDNCLSMFQTVLNRIGAEFTFTGTVVTVRERIGIETNHMYRHRLNASNIVHEVDAQDFWTYARGYGNFEESKPEEAKLKREYSSPLIRLLGKREAPPIKDGRIKNSSTMDRNLKKLVDESVKISVTADLVDLRRQNYPYAQSKLGDIVALIDERIGLHEDVRVVARSIQYNWKNEILDLKFTFGTSGLTKRYQAKLGNAAKTINAILDGRQKLPFNALSEEVQIATKLLQSVQSQLSIADDGSLIAVDKKDPNNLVIFNAAGLGVSDDGGRTFKSAITGRGIHGDMIIANTILADALAANTIVVGFNKHSTNVKLYSDRIEFFHSGILSGRVTDDGQEFWYGTRKIGRMGAGNKEGSTSIRGVHMNLEYTGDFVSFGKRLRSTDASYTSLFAIDPEGKLTGKAGIVFSESLQVRGHDILDVFKIKPSGTGTAPLALGYTTLGSATNVPMIGNSNLTAGIAMSGSTLYLVSGNTYWSLNDIVSR